MLFKVIELLKILVQVASENASLLVDLLNFFWLTMETIVSVMWYCLPDVLAGVLMCSVAILIALKIIQFH